MAAGKDKTTDLVVPASIRRRTGIKAGDQLEYRMLARTITITAKKSPTHRPTKSEMAAIGKGEAQIANGESVTLTQLLCDVKGNVDSPRGKGGHKTTRKIPG